jgi:hypothetical protein
MDVAEQLKDEQEKFKELGIEINTKPKKDNPDEKEDKDEK